MKTTFIAALLIAAGIITFISCNWFSSSDPRKFNIQGKWIVDSIENKDSDSSNSMAMLAFVIAAKDSLPLGFEFKSDSTYSYINVKDSTGGKYYITEDKNTLFVKEDSAYYPLQFITKNDSGFSVISPDSLVFHLRRSK